MKKHNLAFIDIETTGLDATKHEIIEIGCVVASPELEVVGKFELKIKPRFIERADPVALKINHYAPEEWEKATDLKSAMEILAKRTADCIMVAQNVSFDAGFLEHAFREEGVANGMHYHKLDTVSIAWAKLHRKPDITHFSLRELCLHFGIENEKAHSALSDAYATYELYKKLMEL